MNTPIDPFVARLMPVDPQPAASFDAAVQAIEHPHAELERLKEALRAIERLGHGKGHGFGYSCAEIAQKALEGCK